MRLNLIAISALATLSAFAFVACGGGEDATAFGGPKKGTGGEGSGANGAGANGAGANGAGANGAGANGAGANGSGGTGTGANDGGGSPDNQEIEPFEPAKETPDIAKLTTDYASGAVSINGAVTLPTPSATPKLDGITDWKNGARAAYTIVHDDVCDYNLTGVEKNWKVIADRGLVSGFGFIVSRCDRTGTSALYTGKSMWTHLDDLEKGNQDLINHSWNHFNLFALSQCSKCTDEASCNQVCPDEFKQPDVDPATLEIKRDSECNMTFGSIRGTPAQVAQAAADALKIELIDSNEKFGQSVASKKKAQFFVFPLDLADDNILSTLQANGYLGARGGDRNQIGTINHYNLKVSDPLADFRVTLDAYNEDAEGASRHEEKKLAADVAGDAFLNYTNAILANGGWGLRELHSIREVDKEGGHGWGPATLAKYTTHLDMVKEHVAKRLLWNASNVDVVKYRRARTHCGPAVLTGNQLTFQNASSADCLKWGAGVMVTVSIQGPDGYTVAGGKSVGGGRVLVDVDPTKGATL